MRSETGRIFLILAVAFSIFFFFAPKIALLVFFMICSIILALYEKKAFFYTFIVLLPVSFSVDLNLFGIQDIFIADLFFLCIFIAFLLEKVLREPPKIEMSLLVYLLLIFCFISVLSIIYAKIRLDQNELYRINSILHIKYAILNKQTLRPPVVGNIVLFFRTVYPFFLYYYVRSEISTEEKEIKLLLKFILVAGVLVSIFGWLTKLDIIPGRIMDLYTGSPVRGHIMRISSTFDNPQAFGAFLSIPLSVCYYYILQREKNVLLWFLFVFMLSIFVFTYSLGAFAAFLCSLLLITFTSKRSSFSRLILFGLIAFFVAFFFLKNDIILAKIRGSVQYVNPRKIFPSTTQARLIQWGRWLEIMRKHVLLGLGYPLVWTDNNYLKMFVNAGILGFLTFWTIVIHMTLKGIAVLRKGKNAAATIFLSIAMVYFIHSFSYDLSAVFKMNAYFFIFAAIISRLHENENN